MTSIVPSAHSLDSGKEVKKKLISDDGKIYLIDNRPIGNIATLSLATGLTDNNKLRAVNTLTYIYMNSLNNKCVKL